MGPMDTEGIVLAYTLDHMRWQKHEAMAERVTAAFANAPTDFYEYRSTT